MCMAYLYVLHEHRDNWTASVIHVNATNQFLVASMAN